MSQFQWTTEAYMKIVRDNLHQLNLSVDSYSPTLPPEQQRVVIAAAQRFASEVERLASEAYTGVA